MINVVKPLLIPGLIMLGMSTASAAMVMPMTSDFENGTDNMGWTNATDAPPVVITGDTNNYLQIQSFFNASSKASTGNKRITFYNQDDDENGYVSKWSGDYSSIESIAGKVMNDASSDGDLYLRLGLKGTSGYWYSNAAVVVPNDGDWYDFSFSLSDDFTDQAGSGSAFSEELLAIESIRLTHNQAGGFWGGESMTATVGFDDIAAVGSVSNVPLPAAAWFMLSGLAGLGGVSFRSRKA